MASQKWDIITWNVGGLVGKHHKYTVMDWIKTLPYPPLIIGLQELKASPFLSTIALNMIAPNYKSIVSHANVGKGGTTLLYHPNLTLEDSGILNVGIASWGTFKIDNITFSIAIIYAPSDSARARAFL